MKKIIFVFLFSVLLTSCGGKSTNHAEDIPLNDTKNSAVTMENGHTPSNTQKSKENTDNTKKLQETESQDKDCIIVYENLNGYKYNLNFGKQKNCNDGELYIKAKDGDFLKENYKGNYPVGSGHGKTYRPDPNARVIFDDIHLDNTTVQIGYGDEIIMFNSNGNTTPKLLGTNKDETKIYSKVGENLTLPESGQFGDPLIPDGTYSIIVNLGKIRLYDNAKSKQEADTKIATYKNLFINTEAYKDEPKKANKTTDKNNTITLDGKFKEESGKVYYVSNNSKVKIGNNNSEISEEDVYMFCIRQVDNDLGCKAISVNNNTFVWKTGTRSLDGGKAFVYSTIYSTDIKTGNTKKIDQKTEVFE